MTQDEEENLNNLIYIKETGSFSGGPVVKNLPYNARDTDSILGLGRAYMLRSN